MMKWYLLAVLLTVCCAYEVDFSGCDYLETTENGKLFSWFFPHASSNDLIMWHNGGPGCSSLMGMLYENGPFKIENGQPVPNNSSWTQKYNVLYIDSPVGTGYSYGGRLCRNESEVALDYVTGLTQFFEKHPNTKDMNLWFTGESYCGKYAPYIALEMLSKGWNLKGIALGNAMIDPINQVEYFGQYLFSTGFVNGPEMDELNSMQTRVKQLILQQQWIKANDEWNNLSVYALDKGGWFNPADIRKFGFPDFSEGENWLNLREIRKKMGVPSFVQNFTMCNNTVGGMFAEQEMKSVASLYGKLLDSYSLKMLFFNGNMDFTIPMISTEGWINKLDWYGSQKFSKQNRTVWRSTENNPFDVAGFAQSSSDLRMNIVSVVNAGHMVCRDQPQRAFQMIDTFIQNKTFPIGTKFPPNK